MARVIVSSSALARNLAQHAGADFVQLRVAGGCCSLWSDAHTNAVPCESRWEGRARLALPPLREALAGVADQPITLDLHWEGPGTLYATRSLPGDSWEMVEFNLPA